MPSEAISCQLTLMSYLLSATSCQLPEYFQVLSRHTHNSRLTLHFSLFTLHSIAASFQLPEYYKLLLTTYSQLILRLRSAQATFTTHDSRLTTHFSLFTFHFSFFIFHLTALYMSLTSSSEKLPTRPVWKMSSFSPRMRTYRKS